MELLRVTYAFDADPEAAEARAAEVAVEQTVEVPPAVARVAGVEARAMGRVEAVEAGPEGGSLATIAYPVETTSFDPAQLLNVIFGNSSLHDDVRCEALDVPASLLRALEGPRFGIEGLRKTLGVADRALTCTAIKPMGLSTAELAGLCESFARAGIDVIKDDHGLADQQWSRFEERVAACQRAVRTAAESTGRLALYVPNLIGTPERVVRGLRHAEGCGARAVMVSPMLIGLPTFWELVHRHASVPVLAHPSFGGAQRFAPEALFGQLYRLFGADAVIFVSFGSRFSAGRDRCRELARRLVRPWGGIQASLPVPAGGIRLDVAAEVASFYGPDAMLLVGGDLQVEGGSVFERARRFAEAVADAGGRSG